MKLRHTFIAAIAALTIAPAAAQTIELVETIGAFQVSRVASSKVCFATYNGLSEKGIPSLFATYKLKDGDRWQVAGYSDRKDDPESTDALTIRFDDEVHMIIKLQVSKGTYFLPFTSAIELKQFDEKVETSNKVTFSLLRSEDKITLDLAELRAAKASIETCLAGI